MIKIPNLEDMPRENGYFSSLVSQSQAIAPAEVSRREIRKVDSRNPMSVGRILVVEDDDCLRRVTQAQLAKCGYQTEVAGDPEALALLEKQAVDLVLTDMNLPGMSGLELLKSSCRLPGDQRSHHHRIRYDRHGRGRHQGWRVRLHNQTGPS